ncbi:MAG: hypothetical protein HON23_03190 [Rickettsiales bacterium]|jgi:hypothetical protein|nr:hypothetical protein [Rickettsiales bacterium]
MLRGFFLSAIFHLGLLLAITYLLPYFIAQNSFIEISVDIISQEKMKPDVISVKEPVEKPKLEEPKEEPKPEESKQDDKIRQINDIAVLERPKAKKPEQKVEKKQKGEDGLIDDLPEADSGKLDDILDRIKKAQQDNLERQKAVGSGALTDGEIGSIKRQVNSCWFNMYGRVFDETDLRNINVKIYVALDENGNVTDIRPIENVESYMDLNNHLYRKILDSAVHSFIACKKIQNLPKSKYKHWKEFEFTFSPSEAY